MKAILICPYCQSKNTETVYEGNLKQTEKTVCKSCGRTVFGGKQDGVSGETHKISEEEIRQLTNELAEDTVQKYFSNTNKETGKDAEILSESIIRGGEKRYVRLQMNAYAMGVHRTEVLEVPFEDSKYNLWEMNYPLCRFGTFKIERGTVAIDNEISLLTRHPIKTEKHFTAYGYGKVPWEETIEITITEIWK